MPFDGMDPAGNLGQHGGRVARAGADFQDPVAGLHLGRLDHQGDDIRLRDGLGSRIRSAVSS